MADKFDEVVGKGAELAVGHIAGMVGLSPVLEAFKVFIPDGANARFQKAVDEDAKNLVYELDRRLRIVEEQLRREGKKLDEFGGIRTMMIMKSLVHAFGNTFSDVKQDALVTATVRQFDSRFGGQETRKHWLDRIAALSDLEIRIIKLLHEHSLMAYIPPTGELIIGAAGMKSNAPAADQAALGAALQQMSFQFDPNKTPPLVQRTQQEYKVGAHGMVLAHALTVSGKIVAGFIAPI